MDEPVVVVVTAAANKQEVVQQWRGGAIVDFTAFVVTQDWVDALSADRTIERVLFSNCSFAEGISFAGLRFGDGHVDFGFSQFLGSVSFADGVFAGLGDVNFFSARFGGDADFSGVDFGRRSTQFNSAVFEGDVSFAHALLGTRVDLAARFRSNVSFEAASLAEVETAFGNARFSNALNLDRVRASDSALVTFRGIYTAAPERTTAADTDIGGEVQVFGEAPGPIMALRSVPAKGKDNPLRGLLRVSFGSGPLQGRSYRMAGAPSVLNLIDKIGGDCTTVVSRSDIDFGVTVSASGTTVVVASLTDPEIARQFDAIEKWNGLDQILLRLQV